MTSLRTRLVVLLAVPLLVLIVAAALGLSSATRAASRARAAAREVDLSLAASNTTLQLSRERHLSASALVAPDQSSLSDELTFQRGKTSQAVATLQAVAGQASRLDRLSRLGGARQAVDDRRPSADEVLETYAELIGPVVGLDDVPDHVGDARLQARLTAHHALTSAIREVAHQQSLLAGVFTSRQMDATTYERLLGLRAGENLWLDQFEHHAGTTHMRRYHEASSIPATTTAQRLRQGAVAAGPAGTITDGDAEVWSSAMGRRIDLLESLAHDLAGDLDDAAADRQATASRRQLVALALLVGAVVLAAALGALLYRTGLQPLRELAWATRSAAKKVLPATVDQARREGPEAVRRTFAPLELPQEQELYDVASSFNTLQERVADLATDGGPAGAQAGTVFLNFGRRTQNLVSQQLGHIDDLEARTEDPDTLEDLFLLDHLATRLRRNAESLVVMAGADSPRRWSRPVTIVNVVRAAAAETTDYSRVDVEPMPPGSVIGANANDVSHLLAELVDNALAFSPADCRVTIGGDWRPDGGYMVTVTDAGPGMSRHQLAVANDLLRRTPTSENELSHHFGLFVVGRFAQRHGVEVELVANRPRGTTARVTLPAPVMARSLAPTTPPAPPPPPGTAPPPADRAPVAATEPVGTLRAAPWPSG